MAELRKGRQTPTQSVVLPYLQTKGQEAIDMYNSSGRTRARVAGAYACRYLGVQRRRTFGSYSFWIFGTTTKW